MLAMPVGAIVRRAVCLALTVCTFACAGCASTAKVIAPSNQRNWAPDQAVLSHAAFEGDRVTVHNVRNCTYLSDEEYLVDHYDKTFDLASIKSVDFLVVPFPDVPTLAHTMLSFGFEGGDYVCISVEIRKEQDEGYAAWKGGLRQYELMYVVGDERDLIKLRTNHRKDDVYLYPGRATPEQARALFVDVMQRVNKLYREPEFYDTLTNNCTTNIVRHINRLRPGAVPYDLKVLLPGHSDRLAYDLGLLDTDRSFEETKRLARINGLAERFANSEDFSEQVRQNIQVVRRGESGGLVR